MHEPFHSPSPQQRLSIGVHGSFGGLSSVHKKNKSSLNQLTSIATDANRVIIMDDFNSPVDCERLWAPRGGFRGKLSEVMSTFF